MSGGNSGTLQLLSGQVDENHFTSDWSFSLRLSSESGKVGESEPVELDLGRNMSFYWTGLTKIFGINFYDK